MYEEIGKAHMYFHNNQRCWLVRLAGGEELNLAELSLRDKLEIKRNPGKDVRVYVAWDNSCFRTAIFVGFADTPKGKDTMEGKIIRLVKEFKRDARGIEKELEHTNLRHYTELARYGMQCQAQTMMLMAQRMEQRLK